MIDPFVLPPALSALAPQTRWVCWKWIVGKNGKRTKPPYQARYPNRFASSTKPETWSDLDACVKTYSNKEVDGIGYALKDSDVGAIDIDDCRNKETGQLHPWAASVVDRANAYCEITPSQEGIRIIGRCGGPPVHRKLSVSDGVSCELYRVADRDITITGQQIGAVTELANIDGLIDQLLAELEGNKQHKKTNNKASGKTYKKGPHKHDLDSLIKGGCGTDFGGDRSRATWYVILELLRLGDDPEAVVATILDPANGISAHCLDQSNPEKYACQQVEKAQQERAKEAEKDKDEAELERFARLSPFDYERQRKDAAEKLGVRASMLDRLVDAKRSELGIDQGDGLQGSAVIFLEPEPWPDPISGDKLLSDLAEAIGRHVVMATHARDLAALWVVHSHLLDVFLITPRLAVRSPTRRCGKTTLLDVLARLVLRPLPAANTSASAIFRVIEGYRPTLLIDEADTFLRDNDELRGVLNSGHRRGGSVLRTVGDDHEPRSFATYGACTIALIGQLPGTLADRSVTVDLKRRKQSEQVEPFRLDRTEHLDTLARKIARWAGDNAERVRAADPEMPDGVFNREADNLRPLLAIADVAGGEWPERARKAAGESLETEEADEGSRLELLLGDIQDIFKASDHLDKLASAVLIERLIEIDGHPAATGSRSPKPRSPGYSGHWGSPQFKSETAKGMSAGTNWRISAKRSNGF
jgi:putative DNA primase/helicase